MIWRDYLKLSENASYSKLALASKAPPGGMGLTLERPGGSNGPPIGLSDLEFEALKQSKSNFQYL